MAKRTAYELFAFDSFDLEHRALMAMLKERRVDPFERADIENMTVREIALELHVEFREEYLRIPAGTPSRPCRWCQAPLYWIRSRAGSSLKESVSIAGPECFAPTDTKDGNGFSHLADCPRSVYLTMGNDAPVSVDERTHHDEVIEDLVEQPL